MGIGVRTDSGYKTNNANRLPRGALRASSAFTPVFCFQYFQNFDSQHMV
jgi:hypothetical protein